MAGHIDAVPSDWNYGISLLEIYRECVSVEENFELPIIGKLHHWGQEFSFESPVKIEIEASPEADDIKLNVSVATRVSATCSRCLERGEIEINGNLRYLVSLCSSSEIGDGEEKARESDPIDEEKIIISSPDEIINIGELAWEVLIVTLPPTVLCSAGCLGLCPECGANLNKIKCGCGKDMADPRFEALRGLLENDKD